MHLSVQAFDSNGCRNLAGFSSALAYVYPNSEMRFERIYFKPLVVIIWWITLRLDSIHAFMYNSIPLKLQQ